MADLDISSVDFSFNSDETISGLSAKQISLKINDLDEINRHLRLEIELLGGHLKRLDSSLQSKLHGVPTHKDGFSSTAIDGCPPPSNSFTSFGSSSKYSRRMSKSRSSVSDRCTKLSSDQKLFILQKERDDLEREKKSFEMKSNKMSDGLDAVLKEAALNLTCLEKEEQDFNEAVLPLLNQNSADVLNRKIPAKKLMRYFTDKLKAKNTMAANLRIENSSLKTKLHKLKVKIKQEEELGDTISAVDFQQMEIESIIFSKQEETKNDEIRKLKHILNSANQNLKNANTKLADISNEYLQTSKDLESRVRLKDKIEKEQCQVVMETERLKNENDRLKRLTEEFEVPSILEYMECKKGNVEMKNMIRSWKRKVDVAEMIMKNQIQQIKARVDFGRC